MLFEYQRSVVGNTKVPDLVIAVSELLKAKNYKENEKSYDELNAFKQCIRIPAWLIEIYCQFLPVIVHIQDGCFVPGYRDGLRLAAVIRKPGIRFIPVVPVW